MASLAVGDRVILCCQYREGFEIPAVFVGTIGRAEFIAGLVVSGSRVQGVRPEGQLMEYEQFARFRVNSRPDIVFEALFAIRADGSMCDDLGRAVSVVSRLKGPQYG